MKKPIDLIVLALCFLCSTASFGAAVCVNTTAETRNPRPLQTYANFQNLADLCNDPYMKYSGATLGGNPALPANTCTEATTGIICEGATANTIETLLTFTDPTTDRTITFPDATGTVIVDNGAVELSGSLVTTTSVNAGTNLLTNGFLRYASFNTTTIADDAAGTKPASTITPSKSIELCACNDSTGCSITVSESGALAGSIVEFISTGSGNCEFADSAGVTELAGAFVAGPTDTLRLIYINSAWHEMSRSNN